MSQLATRIGENGAIEKAAEINVGAMMQAIIEKGVTGENVQVMRDLLEMQREIRRDDAKAAFARAFAALQRETGKIQPNKQTDRSAYASYDWIMDRVQPLLEKHGFSVAYEQEINKETKWMTIIACIMHEGGHERKFPFTVRATDGPPKSSAAQIDGSNGTYAKRYALCNALNIVIGLDTDARLEGDPTPIDHAKADALEKRVVAINGDAARLLSFIGAESFRDMTASQYQRADEQVRRREAAHRSAQSSASDAPPPVDAVPEPICGFTDHDDWRSACTDALVKRGATVTKATKGLDAVWANMPPRADEAAAVEARRKVWGWLCRGQLDKHAGIAK